jgi:hypothetical protein
MEAPMLNGHRAQNYCAPVARQYISSSTGYERKTADSTGPERRPFYYVVVRIGGDAHKEATGRDRHRAGIELRRITAAVGDSSYRPRPTIGFAEWADRWLAALKRKPSTVGSYPSTIVHAKEIFGSPTRPPDRRQPKRLHAFTGSFATAVALPRHELSTSGCSAPACKQPCRIDTQHRMPLASSRGRKRLARNARRLRTSRNDELPSAVLGTSN